MRPRWLLAVCLVAGCADASLAPDPGQLGFTTLSAGKDHSCGTVGSDVYCWGSTAGGLLGVSSDTTAEPLPRRVLLGPIRATAVAAGDGISCVLTTEKRALCWGDGDAAARPASGADSMTAIAVGNFACGLSGSGAAQCWSAPGGAATTVTAATAFSAIAVGGMACGVTTDSTVACWEPSTPTASAVGGAASIIAVAAGRAHACAINVGGTVLCWGANESGQLGDNTHASHAGAEPAGFAGTAVAVSAADDYTCVTTSSGEVWCWGAIPWLGQSFSFLVRAGVGFHLTAVSLGATHACALDVNDATPYCWGQNTWGQLGDGTATSTTEPTLVDGIQ
jgi:alpha-tubulin suppressor-like RCC1 family protein